MPKKTTLVDVDGVLADFTQACLDRLNAASGLHHTIEDVTHYHGIWELYPAQYHEWVTFDVQAPGFAQTLQPYPGAAEFIADLKMISDVYVVTSSWGSPTWAYDREEWLITHMGIDRDHIISTRAKHRVQGDFFFDDKPEHIEAWSKQWPEAKAYLWSQPYNRGYDTPFRVSSFAEAFDKVQRQLARLGVRACYVNRRDRNRCSRECHRRRRRRTRGLLEQK